ncbi:MAG TPA: hypothetical protein VKH19_06685 [Gemmatimonadaceae bacterium]|nr:hypothetical protein [Gemmatimonadaceae bacterium]
MQRFVRRTLLCTAIGIVLATRPVAAQQAWSTTTYGVAEYGTEETTLLLAGFNTGPGGYGLHPRVGAQAYWLTYNPTNRTNVTLFRPFVGLANNYHGGSVSANVGYAFMNKDVAVPVSSGVSGKGVVVATDVEYWGPSAHSLAYQLLGAYNFGSDNLWTRGRLTVPLRVTSNGSSTRIGGELAFQDGDLYRAWQPGGVLEFHDARGQIVILGAGAKLIQGSNTEAFFRLEGVLPIGR